MICRGAFANTRLHCVQFHAPSQRAAVWYQGERCQGNTSIACAVGRSPSSIAEAFFKSSTSSGRSDGVGQEQPSDVSNRSGPDAVVSFLSDDIVAAAFEHARQLRTPEEAIDVDLDLCLQAAHTRCRVPIDPGDAPKSPPFLDTYAERALKYAGVSEYRVVSSVSVSPTEHVTRYAVVMDSGEQACLTFQLAWESVVRAAYRGIATENAWALKRVRGESIVLLDEPHASMGPEGSLAQHINALRVGDVQAAFKFIASHVHEGDDPFTTYKEQLDSPLFRPLLSHISSQVVSSRHSSPCRMSSIVKVIPDPRRVHPHANQHGSSSSDALFYFTLSTENTAMAHTEAVATGWYIVDVKVVPVQFVNAWSRRW